MENTLEPWARAGTTRGDDAREATHADEANARVGRGDARGDGRGDARGDVPRAREETRER